MTAQTDTSRPNPRSAEVATIACRNPATLERMGDVPAMHREEVEERVARARRAQSVWGKTTFAERRRVMKALLASLVDRQAEICRLTARDSGKTMRDAAIGEVFPVAEKLRYLISHGEADLAPEVRSFGLTQRKLVRVEYPALGVIGAICAWGAPFHDLFAAILPALFSGNAVVCKVSEWTSWSAADFQAVFDDTLMACGYPADLVQITTGAEETALALASSGVDKLFFSGSPGAGRKIMEAAAQALTPVVLALDGKDAMIICDDADLDQAVEQAMLGVFTACGQTSASAQRLYVMDGIYDRFVGCVVDKVRRLRQGPPSHDDEGRYDVGALTTPQQLEIVSRQIEDARTKGARVLVGGQRNPVWKGQFFEPTVLIDCDHTMAIAREPTWGPVMTIVRVHTEEEAVRLANDGEYGMSASLFTTSSARGERMASAISAGVTVVNDCGIGHLAPTAGLRRSAFGKISTRQGLRACTSEKTVVTDRRAFRFASKSYPIGRGSYGLVEGAIALVYGDARQKLAGALRLGRALKDRWQAGRSVSRNTNAHRSS